MGVLNRHISFCWKIYQNNIWALLPRGARKYSELIVHFSSLCATCYCDELLCTKDTLISIEDASELLLNVTNVFKVIKFSYPLHMSVYWVVPITVELDVPGKFLQITTTVRSPRSVTKTTGLLVYLQRNMYRTRFPVRYMWGGWHYHAKFPCSRNWITDVKRFIVQSRIILGWMTTPCT